jgi:hypothetical protein
VAAVIRVSSSAPSSASASAGGWPKLTLGATGAVNDDVVLLVLARQAAKDGAPTFRPVIVNLSAFDADH